MFPKQLPKSNVLPAMDAPTLRWGILGTGWIAEQFTASVQIHTQQIIAAAGSRSIESANRFTGKFDIPKAHGSYEQLVNDDSLDVIYIATPHNCHYEHVLLALNAGKHVLVEKPVALNHAQSMEMVALAREKGLFFCEALWTYFLPKFDVFRQIIASGVLGDIRSVYTEYGEYLPTDHRIFDPKLAGGPILDLGTYPVSFIAQIMGVPNRVVGLGQLDPSGVNGQLAVAMEHEAGNLSTMASSIYGFSPTNAAIIGSEASLRFEGPFNLPGGFSLHSQTNDTVLHYEEPAGRHFDGLYYEAAEVARCIAAGKTESPCRPLNDTLDTMKTLDLIRDAIGLNFDAAGLVE